MKRISDLNLVRYAPDVVFIIEPDGRIIFANENAVSTLGYTLSELQSMTVLDVSPADWRETYRAGLQRVVVANQPHVFEIRIVTRLRKKIPMELHIVKMPNGLLYGSCRDITERKQHAAQLAEVHQNLVALIETIPDPIFLKDGQGRWLITNQPAKDLYQLHHIDWQGKTDMQLAALQPQFRSSYEVCVKDDLAAWNKGSLVVYEEIIPGTNGHPRTFEVLKMPTFHADGNRKGLVIIGRDITAHKQALQHIHELAFYDSVTMLPNRRFLLDRLTKIIVENKHSNRHTAVLLLDLDHYKTTRSDIADALLRAVADRLSTRFSSTTTLTCLGGDIFVIVLADAGQQLDEAVKKSQLQAESIHHLVGQPYALGDEIAHTTVSIGITLFNHTNESPESLLQQARMAMERARKSGINHIDFYDAKIRSEVQRRNELEHELRRANDHQQFELHYQVQVNNQQQLLGAEVLLRWQHPQRGLLMPQEFIPLCEESGLILPIGLWVLEEACAQLKRWQAHPQLRNIHLAINVSAKQFHQTDFVAQVQRILMQSGVKASQIKIELTESSMLEDMESTIAIMRELKLLGINFSLDDFGTGYSSLQYLKRLPLDQFKIDQSFVCDIANNPSDAIIVKTIISMADALGLNVIAEGVETQAQCDFLNAHGCHTFQGYLFGRPLPAAEFEASLR